MNKPMRDFVLETFMSKWEFTAKYNMTASDAESMRLPDLLAMASDEDREDFETLSLGYTRHLARRRSGRKLREPTTPSSLMN